MAASESTKIDREHFDDHERDDEDLESLVGMLGPTDHPEMLGRIGHYEVAGVLGRGGMGAVFKAFDHSLNRFVAIKVMLPHLAASGAARKRFAREAQAAAAVVDDHVMAIHSVSEWKSMPYIVMPYTRGISLQKRLQDQGPLELREILRIAMQSARGLAAAHAQGLVHRDIKPANIFLQDNVERVQLMDFGLARAANDNAGLTRTGMLAGTPQYMSPEQVRAEAVDGRSDLYGLGAVMYAICTGYPPYRAESSYAVLRMITDQSPRAIRELNPDIPEWLCAIISKLMAKQSKERFASAAEVANLLEACLAHVQEPTRSPLPAAVEALVPKPRPSRRGFWTGAAIAASMLGMLGLVTAGGVMLVLRLNQGELTIESEVSDIPIRVRQGDHVVDRMTINRDGKSLRVAAGEYIVEVEGKFDDLMIENSQVTLARGGTAVVKIKEQPAEHGDHAHSHGDDHAPSQWTPLVESPAVRPQEIPLGNLVDQYNASSNKVDDFALTEDEVKAYCRWQLTHNPDLKTDTERFYERIATDGQVAKGWSISTVRHWIWSEADKILAGYQIIFAFTGNGENSVGEWNLPPIRQRHFAPAIGYLKPTQVGDPGSIPLSAVLKQFNKQHVEVAGRKQPELNEQEVLAAIFAWKDRRKEANVDDVTFEKFQEILKTHYLPQGAELELVHKFTGAPDETIYKATAQIKLPLHNNPKRSYAFVIRELFIEAVRGESSQVPVFVGDSTKSDSHGSSVKSEYPRSSSSTG